MTTDLRVTQSETGIWDFSLDENGDLANGDFLDTSITYAILGEKRASPSEVPISQNRRGWNGNEGKSFENGSKIWLFHQSRLTRSVLSDLESEALSALNYFIVNNAATEITANALFQNQGVTLEIKIFTPPNHKLKQDSLNSGKTQVYKRGY